MNHYGDPDFTCPQCGGRKYRKNEVCSKCKDWTMARKDHRKEYNKKFASKQKVVIRKTVLSCSDLQGLFGKRFEKAVDSILEGNLRMAGTR